GLTGQRRVREHLRRRRRAELLYALQRPHDIALDERREPAPAQGTAGEAAHAAGRSTMSNGQTRWSPSGSTGRTSAGLTAPIVSFSRYGSSGKNTCVTNGSWPGASTLKWMCAGRHGCWPTASRYRPTGPSVGTVYGFGSIVWNSYDPSSSGLMRPRKLPSG